MANFDKAFETALGHEDGFTNDPRDDGNWTGGKRGVGECRGTKFGISAKTYPYLIIKDLTVEQAKTIYRVEWWELNHYGDIVDQKIATKVFDLAINMGGPNPQPGRPDASRANSILQFATWVLKQNIVVDGDIGPKTIAAVNAVDPVMLLQGIRDGAEKYYRDLVYRQPAKAIYLKNWVERARS